MSLTITNRPLGHRLNTTDVDATIIDDGTGDALVYTGSAHGLSDGDYVYIESNFDSYNGFKYVDSIAYDSFKIKDSAESDPIEYVQDADILYRASVLHHGWQSVHLPIVYEIESDLWPNNVAEESYTPVTVVSQADSNGNTQLNLSVGIAGLTALNWIELVGVGSLAGPYQILSVSQPWQLVINLEYDAGNSFSGLQVVNYYKNYAINVNVYSGLSSDHRWYSKKPFELAQTLKFIPDSDGKIKFSIHDVLKGYITTRNNLTLDTLPNNLDFYTGFYIGVFESYDDSDGETIATFEGTETIDDFIGHAVNSFMPFKSENMSWMSEYINADTFLARWLTLFDRPVMVVDRFFDLSFLLIYDGFDVAITIFKGTSSYTNEEIILIENPGIGVIRVPITPQTGYEVYCIQASLQGNPILTLPAMSTGVNVDNGGIAWITGINPTVTLPGSVGTHFSDYLIFEYNFQAGISYTINFDLDRTGGFTLFMYLMDDDNNILATDTNIISGSGHSQTGGIFVAPWNAVKIGFKAQVTVAIPSSDLIIDLDALTGYKSAGDNQIITEQICCDVIEECGGTFTNDQLRLTQGSDPRFLE